MNRVWIDESGFMLQPLVRRTWAPCGQTPIQYSWDRRDRLSGIAALSLSPERQHLGVYFQLHTTNIHAEELIAFLKMVHQHLRRKFILILDRYSVHRHAVRLLKEAGINWFEVEWLPAYAPDLDPVEMIWNHTKYADLANFLPENIDQLQQAVITSIADAGTDQHLLMSFFRYTDLPI
jgi:transposase